MAKMDNIYSKPNRKSVFLKRGLIGCASVSALIALSFGVFLIWPESPTSIDHYGEFDIYDFHSTNIGEPGYTLYELYCHGKRLAEFPRALSINPGKDRILYVDAADAYPAQLDDEVTAYLNALRTLPGEVKGALGPLRS